MESVATPIIEVNAVCKSYGTHKALDNLAFQVVQGGVVGFLGSNGAGKSTLMRILTGFIQADSGSVKVCGFDVSQNLLELRRQIGYLPENNPLYPELRINEFLTYRARLKGLNRKDAQRSVSRVLRLCQLEEVKFRIIGQLSKGYRQRVGLAESMLVAGSLLILDEPMVGLDPNQVREIRELIARLGESSTVFLSTHILHDVEQLCREVIIIDRGCLVASNSPENLCAACDIPRRLLVRAEDYPDVTEDLRQIAAVIEVVREAIKGEGVEYIISSKSDVDLRLQIMQLFNKKEIIIKEMRLDHVRLEDVFAYYTRDKSLGGEAG